MKSEDNGRKPTNYFNELTPEQREAQREQDEEDKRLDAMAAAQQRVNEIGKAQRMFPDSLTDGNGNNDNKPKNGKGDKNKKKRDNGDVSLKKIYIQKHSDPINGILAETVIIGQRSVFAFSESQKHGNEIQIRLAESFGDGAYEYLPLSDGMSRSYVFKDDKEFHYYIEQAKRENLDKLYEKVKQIWSKYIDADNSHLSICAADTIFTYFQDKLGMTHYLFFVGGNDTGKSNNLTVIEHTAYRNFNSVGVTAANIYTFLGHDEEGQGTICEDEADNLDYDYEKMRIDKSGYTSGKRVARTDLPRGERIQNKWNTYCFKAFAAERLPDQIKAKGFHQRIIPLFCEYGEPDHDITEVINTAGEDKFQYLLDELNETHKLLLAYRLLRFHDKIPDVKLNISNREKQLFKPILRLFQNTRTLNELLSVVSKFISQRREKIVNSLETNLYEIIIELINKQGLELESSLIWDTIKETIQGQEIPNRPMSYETLEFGTLSQKRITATLEQIFGAKRPKHKGEIRRLIFDQDRLRKLERKYSIQINVKVMTDKEGADGADWGGSSQYAHISHKNTDTELARDDQGNNENLDNLDKNGQGFTSPNNSNTLTDRPKPPQSAPCAPNLKEYERRSKLSRKRSREASAKTN
jgi:hypothetical protein